MVAEGSVCEGRKVVLFCMEAAAESSGARTSGKGGLNTHTTSQKARSRKR